jgi:hypothetical protein
MKSFLPLTLAIALSVPAAASDLVVTTAKHADAMMGQPAKDSVEVSWIGKDRMRMEDGERVTIVRGDLKKMYIVDTKAKTYSTIDLPLDMKKYLPAEQAPMIEQMMSGMKVTVTPTTETKQIKDWEATRYTLAMSMPGGANITQEIWATKELPIDATSLQEMRATILSANPMGGSALSTEMQKVDGLPVLTERTMSVMGNEAKTTEEVTSIEQKDALAGHYDVPEGFTEKPFDPMAGMGMAAGGRGRRGAEPR